MAGNKSGLAIFLTKKFFGFYYYFLLGGVLAGSSVNLSIRTAKMAGCLEVSIRGALDVTVYQTRQYVLT